MQQQTCAWQQRALTFQKHWSFSQSFIAFTGSRITNQRRLQKIAQANAIVLPLTWFRFPPRFCRFCIDVLWVKLDYDGLVVRSPTKHSESNWGLRIATTTAFALPSSRAHIVPHYVLPPLKSRSKQVKVSSNRLKCLLFVSSNSALVRV